MDVPNIDADGVRRYGQWAGNERGMPEDVTRCVAQVWSNSTWVPYQCLRKRGHGPGGLYCKQHGRMAERGA